MKMMTRCEGPDVYWSAPRPYCMPYLPRHRIWPRLEHFEYDAPRIYFITIITHRREPLLGKLVGSKVVHSAFGRVTDQCWRDIPKHYPAAWLDAFAIMPEHLHGLIGLEPGSPVTVGTIVGSFKAAACRAVNRLRGTQGSTMWQRGFHDRIVRNPDALVQIRHYIRTNAARHAALVRTIDAPDADFTIGS